MKRNLIALLLGLALALASGPGRAQDDPAMTAFMAGDGATAQALWQERAEAGEYEAQARLGMLLSGGTPATGVAPDLDEARYWLGKAVEHVDAALADNLDQRLVQFAYALQIGMLESMAGAVDAGEVVQWYDLAADLGNGDAGAEIAALLAAGADGIERDVALAEEWHEWAAERSPKGQLYSASFFLDRNNVNRALYWLDRAYLTNESGAAGYRETPIDPADGDFAGDMDALLHRAYETILPAPLPGWSVEGIYHEIDTESDAVQRNGDEIRYPIVISRLYAEDAAAVKINVVIILNHAANTEIVREGVNQFKKIDEEFRNAGVPSELHVNMTEPIGDLTAMHLMEDAERKTQHSYSAALENGAVVRSVVETSSGDVETDRQTLLAYMRTVDFDAIARATPGHGVFKESADGRLEKP